MTTMTTMQRTTTTISPTLMRSHALVVGVSSTKNAFGGRKTTLINVQKKRLVVSANAFTSSFCNFNNNNKKDEKNNFGERRRRRREGVVARDASKDSSSSDPAMADDTVPNVNVAASCSVDEPETCSLADLEILYVDALWNYYNDGKFTLSDAQYDRIREELNWQGSGFPTLRRDEIQFVQAAIAYSRGEKIMGDEEYEELKRKIKTDGKRRDVTALLLYTN